MDLTGSVGYSLRSKSGSLSKVELTQSDDSGSVGDSVEESIAGDVDDATSSTSMDSKYKIVAEGGGRRVQSHVSDLNISPEIDDSMNCPSAMASTHADGSGMITHPVSSAGDAVKSNVIQNEQP